MLSAPQLSQSARSRMKAGTSGDVQHTPRSTTCVLDTALDIAQMQSLEDPPFDSASSEALQKYHNPSYGAQKWPKAPTTASNTRLVKMDEVLRTWDPDSFIKDSAKDDVVEGALRSSAYFPPKSKDMGSVSEGLRTKHVYKGNDTKHKAGCGVTPDKLLARKSPLGKIDSPPMACAPWSNPVHHKRSLAKMDDASEGQLWVPSNFTSMIYSRMHTKKRKKDKNAEGRDKGLKIPCRREPAYSLELSSLDTSTSASGQCSPYGSPFFTTSALYNAPVTPATSHSITPPPYRSSWATDELAYLDATDCSSIGDESEFSCVAMDTHSQVVYWNPPVLKTDSEYEAYRRCPKRQDDTRLPASRDLVMDKKASC